jgi:hypothetical protein
MKRPTVTSHLLTCPVTYDWLPFPAFSWPPRSSTGSVSGPALRTLVYQQYSDTAPTLNPSVPLSVPNATPELFACPTSTTHFSLAVSHTSLPSLRPEDPFFLLISSMLYSCSVVVLLAITRIILSFHILHFTYSLHWHLPAYWPSTPVKRGALRSKNCLNRLMIVAQVPSGRRSELFYPS